eukprot:Trichotokara_eunicae@DN3937_c0_g1_i4.p1
MEPKNSKVAAPPQSNSGGEGDKCDTSSFVPQVSQVCVSPNPFSSDSSFSVLPSSSTADRPFVLDSGLDQSAANSVSGANFLAVQNFSAEDNFLRAENFFRQPKFFSEANFFSQATSAGVTGDIGTDIVDCEGVTGNQGKGAGVH